MIHAGEELVALKERVAGYREPVLSVYLNVNPAHPENQAGAYAIRLKDLLKETGAPEKLSARVLGLLDAGQLQTRTLILFASPDGILDDFRLRADLPDVVRFGEPYVVPLALALQQHEPYGVVLLDAHRARLFVSVLGETEEELDAENVFVTSGWREMTISPSTAAPSGGAAKDSFERRVEAQTSRFYKVLGETVRDLAERRGLARLFLAGPRERTAAFARTLPRPVVAMVAATVPLPIQAPEEEVVRRVLAAEERARERREQELLAEARERGAGGLDETLESLQEGRVHHVLVPWPTGESVRWCDLCGAAFTGALRCPYCGGATRERGLAETVLEIAEARGARVVFVRDAYADALRRELGGLAGLVRF